MNWHPDKGMVFRNKQGKITAWCLAAETEDCDIVSSYPGTIKVECEGYAVIEKTRLDGGFSEF